MMADMMFSAGIIKYKITSEVLCRRKQLKIVLQNAIKVKQSTMYCVITIVRLFKSWFP